jgi:hypothetical protein
MRSILEFLLIAAMTSAGADRQPGGYQSSPKPTFKQPIAAFEIVFFSGSAHRTYSKG